MLKDPLFCRHALFHDADAINYLRYLSLILLWYFEVNCSGQVQIESTFSLEGVWWSLCPKASNQTIASESVIAHRIPQNVPVWNQLQSFCRLLAQYVTGRRFGHAMSFGQAHCAARHAIWHLLALDRSKLQSEVGNDGVLIEEQIYEHLWWIFHCFISGQLYTSLALLLVRELVKGWQSGRVPTWCWSMK